jgi:hypothetical protein
MIHFLYTYCIRGLLEKLRKIILCSFISDSLAPSDLMSYKKTLCTSFLFMMPVRLSVVLDSLDLFTDAHRLLEASLFIAARSVDPPLT